MAIRIPSFTYNGSYRTEMIGDYWYIFFLTSGTLRMDYSKTADLYLHGGGGGGSNSGYNSSGGSGGGGGWLESHFGISVNAGTAYDIVIGDGGAAGRPGATSGGKGGTSSAFGKSVEGGNGGTYMGNPGTGGSGNGGSRSSAVGGIAGDGESNTTYAFNDSSLGLLYGGGGAGGGPEYGANGQPGKPYGGAGTTSAVANTGAGGGGAHFSSSETGQKGGAGGSGIVILRGYQDDILPVKFNGTTLTRMIFDGSEVKHLIHNGTRLFTERFKEWSKPKTLSLQPAH